jgi:ABC-type transport system involved in multi-copper enzyme maturation permease subunit
MMEQAAHTTIKTSILPKPIGASGALAHYSFCFRASFGHSLMLMLRRQRLILAVVISMLPVVIPLAMALLSTAQFAESGFDVFTKMAKEAHINVLAPLLALFFATMIVGEDVESRTIPLMLTRPMPRSAWVLGRFTAYMGVTSLILGASMFLTFAASTALAELSFNRDGLWRLATHEFAMVMALMANGALALLLGALTRRPIIIGVLVLYGWQRLAMVVPGIIDFMTIMKYTNALLPTTMVAKTAKAQEVLTEITKKEFLVAAPKAALVLLCITATLLAIAIIVTRIREYATDRAAGS